MCKMMAASSYALQEHEDLGKYSISFINVQITSRTRESTQLCTQSMLQTYTRRALQALEDKNTETLSEQQ